MFDNPLQHGVPREVSRTTKLFRQLFNSVLDDDGQRVVWASSHTFRRTGITTLHEAGVPDRTIAELGAPPAAGAPGSLPGTSSRLDDSR